MRYSKPFNVNVQVPAETVFVFVSGADLNDYSGIFQASVSATPEFHKAFGCKAGQAMVHETTCRVW